LAALAFAVYEAFFLANRSQAQGVIVANLAHTSRSEPDVPTPGAPVETTTFCPQFEFQSADGKLQRVESSDCTAPPTYAVGQKVSVNYLRSSPDNAQVDSFDAKWGFVLIFGIVAVILLPIGSVLLRRLKLDGHSLDPLSFWD